MAKKWYNLFVSVEGATEPAENAPGDAAQAIAEIAATVQPAIEQRVEHKIDQQATAPSKLMTFAEIYGAAEIPAPGHGYTILKVADMLQSQHIRELPSEVKRSSVLVALEAAGVPIKDVVEDAVRRDKALDAFERVQQKHIEDFELSKIDENRKLQAELDRITADYRAKMQANEEGVASRKEAFSSWRVEKQKEEQRIAEAVSYFVTENPITTSRTPSAKP